MDYRGGGSSLTALVARGNLTQETRHTAVYVRRATAGVCVRVCVIVLVPSSNFVPPGSTL